MKRMILILAVAMLAVGCLTACAGNNDDNGKIKIVTTIFPEYDWVMNILGDNPGGAEVTMLLDSGVDLHSFQPTAEDILKIASCDMFIYVGGESDAWVEDALRNAQNKNRVVINLLEVLGDKVKEEELVEGMQGEEEEEPEYDEHVWLSLKNADILTSAIGEKLAQIDPDNKGVYASNLFQYKKKLKDLDEAYQSVVNQASVKTLLFGDRFPFRYLTDDYNLSYYAAFIGCSAETEASFETIAFLSKKVDECSLHAVMTIEGTNHRIAETIVQNTTTKDQKILSLDSMQSVTVTDVKNGVTYIGIMEKNLDVLKEALK
ncbi:MAG: zinc ABC transporter substrate-binding protein [Lachnospiraceae bacterium]|nr:zinc ABC transporter substrate-binding protein [Lachnospiraceae bacterium]